MWSGYRILSHQFLSSILFAGNLGLDGTQKRNESIWIQSNQPFEAPVTVKIYILLSRRCKLNINILYIITFTEWVTAFLTFLGNSRIQRAMSNTLPWWTIGIVINTRSALACCWWTTTQLAVLLDVSTFWTVTNLCPIWTVLVLVNTFCVYAKIIKHYA